MAGVFAAIDFETADPKRDSACAVAVVLADRERLLARFSTLIRPPRREFSPICMGVHGIRWEMVKDKPTFGEVWPELEGFLRQAGKLAAHNVSFDRSVLRACCEASGIPMPEFEWVCTMKLARDTWQLPGGALPDVCECLAIPLDHHNPVSDAEACARILMHFECGSAPDPARFPVERMARRRSRRKAASEASAESTVATTHSPAASLALAELNGICRGICADQRIVRDEFDLLYAWLRDHEDIASTSPIDAVSLRVACILADGEVSDDELEGLRAFLAGAVLQ